MKSGAHVQIEGELGSREYQKNGANHRVWECKASRIAKLGRTNAPMTAIRPGRPPTISRPSKADSNADRHRSRSALTSAQGCTGRASLLGCGDLQARSIRSADFGGTNTLQCELSSGEWQKPRRYIVAKPFLNFFRLMTSDLDIRPQQIRRKENLPCLQPASQRGLPGPSQRGYAAPQRPASVFSSSFHSTF